MEHKKSINTYYIGEPGLQVGCIQLARQAVTAVHITDRAQSL